MVINKEGSTEFRWIGASSHRSNSCEHYRSFCLNEEIFQVDDFILVRNDLALDPEDISQCYVGKVKDLYETGDEPMPHVAKVQWYSRIFEYPLNVLKKFGKVDSQYEVVEERRSSICSNIVDAETIFGRCKVIFLPVDTNFELLTTKFQDNDVPTFFCRYKYSGRNAIPQINLETGCFNEPENYSSPKMKKNSRPVIEKVNPIDSWKSIDSTPTKLKGVYSATPTGSAVHPKVLIKRLDERILESKNNGARILVADSENESVESIANKFMNSISLNSPAKPYNAGTKASNKNFAVNDGISTPKKVPKLNGIISTPNSVRSSRRKRELFVNGFSEPKKESSKFHTPKKEKKDNDKTSRKLCTPKKEKKEGDIYFDKLCTPKKEFKLDGKMLPSPRKEKQTDDTFSRKLCTPKKTLKIDDVSSSKAYSSCSRKSGDKESGPSPSKIFKSATNNFEYISENVYSITRSGRKVKSVNYYEDKGAYNALASPKLSAKFSKLLSIDDSDSDESCFSTESSSADDSLSESESMNKPNPKSRPSLKRPSVKKKEKNVNIPERKTPLKTPQNVLEESRQRLHVSAVPKSLPCREEEYSDIYTFVKGCLSAQTGGCMYISGVPGTGKTATVHEVMRNLEEEKETGEIPTFSFIEVNGMWMTDPYQCYVHIFKCLTGKTIAPQQAASLLEKHFTEPGPKKDAVVLLVDELDRLWTRKQTVMYNIFDWPTKKHSKLIVLAIANTMDLPERMMMNRIASRLGLTRKTFHPYNFRQLQEIIMTRIQELKVFDPDAVQLVARKVAAVSGDARRALDICRFATEVTKVSKSSKKSQTVLVGMQDVDVALQQMFSSPLISAIKSSSAIAKIFFQCILSEFSRTGSEETTLLKVYQQMAATCRFEGLLPPTSSEVSSICGQLAASHLILVDNFRHDLHLKIRLNVSSDDVNYALTGK